FSQHHREEILKATRRQIVPTSKPSPSNEQIGETPSFPLLICSGLDVPNQIVPEHAAVRVIGGYGRTIRLPFVVCYMLSHRKLRVNIGDRSCQRRGWG